jgi:hypothetical protein
LVAELRDKVRSRLDPGHIPLLVRQVTYAGPGQLPVGRTDHPTTDRTGGTCGAGVGRLDQWTARAIASWLYLSVCRRPKTANMMSGIADWLRPPLPRHPEQEPNSRLRCNNELVERSYDHR